MNNGMFAAGGAFAFLTAFAVYSAIDAARWRNRRRMWLSVAAGLPLGVAACVSLWIGIERPTANFWGNQGFGPEWECNNLGRGPPRYVRATCRRASKASPQRNQNQIRTLPDAAIPNGGKFVLGRRRGPSFIVTIDRSSTSKSLPLTQPQARSTPLRNAATMSRRYAVIGIADRKTESLQHLESRDRAGR